MMNASSQVLIWNTGEDQSISDYFHTWIVTLYLGFQKLVLSWLFNHCRVKIIPFSFIFRWKSCVHFSWRKTKHTSTSFSIWWYVSWTSVILSQNLLEIKPTDIVQLIVRLWGLFFWLAWRSFRIHLSQSRDTDCSNRQNLNKK